MSLFVIMHDETSACEPAKPVAIRNTALAAAEAQQELANKLLQEYREEERMAGFNDDEAIVLEKDESTLFIQRVSDQFTCASVSVVEVEDIDGIHEGCG